VSFGPESLLARLVEFETEENRPERYVIALSGGLDSTVLAHALARTRRQHGRRLLAVHVDHRLHAESAAWARHCRELADSLAIDFMIEIANVDATGGRGLEAAARDARYSILARHVGHNDWLLSAHHRDDQAETLLLNLLRGSGPAGMAGIGSLNRLGAGWLARPMIDVSRVDLALYAESENLAWVEDPSNEDQRFDRNFLRHTVLPLLESRWPDAAARLARSAALAGEASALLEELACMDLERLGSRPARVEIGGLQSLPGPRQRNLLRFALRQAGLPLPGAARLDTIVEQLVTAREDAQPLVAWPGAEARRYRGVLYLLPDALSAPPGGELPLRGDEPLSLGPGMGTLALAKGAAVGLSPETVATGLTVRYREGGESIRAHGFGTTKKLKKLLQEHGIVPWMRDSIPLVFAGDELVAVADLWLAEEVAVPGGAAILWHGKPALR
jgi:tRNA(Ile)-lysidine synthase